MRRARLPLALACAAAVLAAGLHVGAQGRLDDRDRDLRLLAIDANGVSPEFSADALLRIAGSGRVTDKELDGRPAPQWLEKLRARLRW